MKNLLYLSFLFFSVLSFGQERTISGNVISADDGLPLPGVTVVNKNTTRGISVDLDGNYSLVVQSNDTLVFSFIGMKEQTRRVGASDIINVQMQDDGIVIETVYGPAYYPPRPVYPQAVRLFFTGNSPKKAFRKNAENDMYIIFVSEELNKDSDYIYSEEDLDYQKKHNIVYISNNDFSIQYRKKHNKLTFKHLNKKYNKTWQTEIRKDTIGLDEFLK